ncbi:BlaI/MecI/CopY family transcriptional regulator [Ulvibacterium marinum]|uniref:BlaI/MecI/CopY family transcriptional regulator n=1 Tax=Ulvibacterium marinum TaxID=2419782 RepID=UPI001FE9FB6F|nr:BlaI/MecI/CopY family transcriptional regulator [Ulvibacterium marinum]
MNDIKLTNAEESVLKILWEKEKAFIKEVIEEIPGKKPAYSTVSTIMRILERKGYVSYDSFGKSHRYFPLIKREDYTKGVLSHIMNTYFGGDFRQIVSFMSSSNNISISELDEILSELKNQKKNDT